MSNYDELISKLDNESDEAKIEPLKKLIYLAVNDQNNFRKHAQQIVKTMNTSFEDMFDEEAKLLSMQLLSELMTQYHTVVPKAMFELQDVVACLSDEKAEIRKASHKLILTFVKKYEKIDEILNTYRMLGEADSNSWKLTQKIIHSFEGLVTFEPQCVTYSEDYRNMDSFLSFVIKRVSDDNSLLKKASEQALTSFVKNQFTPQILPKLNNYVSEQLRTHSKTVNVRLPDAEDILEEVVIEEEPRQNKMVSKQGYNRTQSLSPKPMIPQKTVQRKSSELRLNVPDSSKHNLEYQSRLSQLLQRIQVHNVWSVKCQAIQQLNRLLITEMTHTVPDLLVERVIDLTSDLNFKTCVTSLNTIYYLVMECFDSVTPHLKSIEHLLLDKICDMKLAIRQLACKIIKSLSCSPSSLSPIIPSLLSRLPTCSLLGKQQIINLITQIYTKQAMRDHKQVMFVVSELSMMLYHENTKIKMKAVDALVRISLATDLEECKRILVKKLNKVYYDMYLGQVRSRMGEATEDYRSKGLGFDRGQFTYQKPFTTKKQLGSHQPNFRIQSDTMSINSHQNNDTFYESKSINNRTMNTTNTETISAGKATVSTNFGEFPTMTMNQKHEEKFSLIVKNKYSGVKDEGEKEKEREESGRGLIVQQKEDKNYQYKPMLVRKVMQDERKGDESLGIISVDRQREDNLIIESREYRDKRPAEEQKPPREQRKSNLKLTKGLSRKRPSQKVQQQAQEQQRLQLVTKPFSKKSSKNQPRPIDYKATHYTSKQQLQPLVNVDQTLKKISVDIRKQDDWSTQFQTLNSIRRVIKHHSETMSSLASCLPAIMPELLKLVESLRSTLAKNAMIALAEMCESLKRNMDPFLQHIFPKLFRKGLDTNVFINEQVRKCLSSLCNYCTPQKIIPIILSNCQSKQNQTKLYILVCIQKLTEKTPNNKLQIIRQSNKLATIIGSYIVDSSAEVRTACKALFCSIVRESPKTEVEGIFRRSTNEQAYTKLKNIMEKEVLAADIVVKTSSKKYIDFD